MRPDVLPEFPTEIYFYQPPVYSRPARYLAKWPFLSHLLDEPVCQENPPQALAVLSAVLSLGLEHHGFGNRC
jgi:hypothetical protein